MSKDTVFSIPVGDEKPVRSAVATGVFIACLIIGLIAITTHWAVAVPGLILGTLILCRLHLKKEQLLGHNLVLAGICFCAFALASRATYTEARTEYLVDVAKKHAMTWLELSQEGRSHEAFQMVLTLSKREKPGTPLVSVFGSPESPVGDYKKYLNLEPERSIRQDGKGGKFIFHQAKYEDPGVDRERIILDVEWLPADPSIGKRDFEMYMERKRHLPQFGTPQWAVDHVINTRPQIPRIRFLD